LWEHRVLIGPQWLVDAAPTLKNSDLADGLALLSISNGHGARLLDETVLAFTDAYVEHGQARSAVVASDPQAVSRLERSCPPDDVAEAGPLSILSAHFVTLDERDEPTAGAGYGESQGILASVGVLTPPAVRRRGHGTLAAAIATNDALDAGLIPQWRARRGHRGSWALAKRLGYREIGSQTTVLLGS
ncbi:MAG TPA: GNAT family N-acetyltransferase, partial [Propionibacteriaceae bacterium]